MDGGSNIDARRKSSRRHLERRLLHLALSSAQRLIHHARNDAILHGHARRVENGEPAVPVLANAASPVQRPPMGQLGDLDDIADVNATAPHGILELALLGGLEPAVELLLPG